MKGIRRFAPVLLLAFCILLARVATAIDVGDVLRALAIGYGVKASSKPINDFINEVTANKGLPVGATTKVVPILTVGEKAYIGAAQVAGSSSQVSKVEAIFQLYAAFDNDKYRIMLLFPNGDINPLNFKRISGVGLTALADVSIAGAAPQLESGGIDTGDVVRAAAIGAAITEVAGPLNDFINKIYGENKAATTYATRVVPRISVGERAYIGGVQVSGTKAAVARVKAAFVYEELFSDGRFRVNLVVPGNSLNPLKFSRVKGVGISAVIDTTVATSIGTADSSAGSGSGSESGARVLARPASSNSTAAVADEWIDYAHAYIEQAKAFVDAKKKESRSSGSGKTEKQVKGKGHKKGHDDDKDDHHARANKRLADARKTLAQAQHARAQKNFEQAIRLAQQSMRIADEAIAMMR